MKYVNINDYVDVELTEKGFEVVNEYYARFGFGITFLPSLKDNEIGFYQ